MGLEENIKKWVVLDNQHKVINEQIKLIRGKKNELSGDIINHLSSTNKTLTINISDGRLNLVETKQANILSYKFLEECFNEYFNDDKKANDLLSFIKDKRTYTTSSSIKRLYNKES